MEHSPRLLFGVKAGQTLGAALTACKESKSKAMLNDKVTPSMSRLLIFMCVTAHAVWTVVHCPLTTMHCQFGREAKRCTVAA